jgi:DNA helicase-2/ATP-dependent DNA helicase PcrA
VVGDDAQSIYAFRGANIKLNFQKDYDNVLETYRLRTKNYRSTKNIVELQILLSIKRKKPN